MNRLIKYFLIVLGVAILGYVLWFFINIVAYIIISLVLSLIGRPVVDML
ncbi:unnamed protein product, partial [marine sediment metagenome]